MRAIDAPFDPIQCLASDRCIGTDGIMIRIHHEHGRGLQSDIRCMITKTLIGRVIWRTDETLHPVVSDLLESVDDRKLFVRHDGRPHQCVKTYFVHLYIYFL